jgi:hypothetical protein
MNDPTSPVNIPHERDCVKVSSLYLTPIARFANSFEAIITALIIGTVLKGGANPL